MTLKKSRFPCDIFVLQGQASVHKTLSSGREQMVFYAGHRQVHDPIESRTYQDSALLLEAKILDSHALPL